MDQKNKVTGMKTFHLSLGMGLYRYPLNDQSIYRQEISSCFAFTDPDMRDIFFISRVPRTLSLLLAGAQLVLLV